MTNFFRWFFPLLVGLLVGAGGYFVYNSQYPQAIPTEKSMAEPMAAPAKQSLFYRNPMNPNITSAVPAKDSMGMDYIPVYADDTDSKQPGTVSIDPVTVQNIGVRTATAQRRNLAHEIRAVGRVTYDEERISRLHPKTEGWVEKMFIDKTGTEVSKNTMLLSVYSPKLVISAQEYLLALKSAKTLKDSPYEDIRTGAEKMVVTARERLRLLDVPDHQIRDMEKTGVIRKGLHIHSPFDGTVIHIGAREGQHVTPQTELYMLADLHKVWVIAQVYEADLPWVNVGDAVDMRLTAVPGKTFAGKVAYIYPYAESKTRTIKLRLTFDNPDLLLKPEMFANVTIHTKQQNDTLTIPTPAIVRSGEHEQVFVARGAGKFEPRKVTTGIAAEGYTQILSGLKPGEKVVTSSQFLIDSESKLNEATAKMLEPQQASPAAMDMSAPATDASEATSMHHDMSEDSMQMDEQTMSHEQHDSMTEHSMGEHQHD